MNSSTHPPPQNPLRTPPPSPPPELVESRRAALADLRAGEFLAWRHHPVSRAVLAYLADYRDSLARDAFQAFLTASLVPAQEGEARGRYLFADDMVNLQWASVLRFYGMEVPGDEG